MYQYVNMRPLPSGYEKVTYRDHLELRYLRWDYLVRVANPRESLLKSKEKIIRYAARRAFRKYPYEFKFMGMDIEDIENIARVYTVSFLGLCSIEKDPEKVKKFVNNFTEKEKRIPTQEEIDKKDNYHLISFLEQRLLECSYIFRLYSKGEAGFVYYSIFYRVSGDLWPTDDELIEGHDKYGWEKLAWVDFVKIRERFTNLTPGYSLELNGKTYRVVTPNTSMVYLDKDIAMDIEPRSVQASPEDEMIEREENKVRDISYKNIVFSSTLNDRLSILIELYRERPPQKQLRILQKLVKWLERRNGFQKEMRKEIDQVKRMASSLKKRIAKEVSAV